MTELSERPLTRHEPSRSPIRLTDVTVPALAYLGDSVLEVLVRTYLVTERGLSTSAHLNRASLDFVCAAAQARAMERIEPHLSEEESILYRRGRNSKHGNVPKHATPADYHRATGMEVLFGYLSLSDRQDRLHELFAIGYLSGNRSDRCNRSNDQ